MADAAAPHDPGLPVDHATSANARPQPAAPQAGGADSAPCLPGLDDVARLHSGSDYAVFMARGVDKAVQRGALKKLFADPHFNIGDGLDLYMGDYNKPDPIPAAMMSALRHSRSFFAAAYPDRQVDEDPSSDMAPESAIPADAQALAASEAPATDTTGATGAATGDKA